MIEISLSRNNKHIYSKKYYEMLELAFNKSLIYDDTEVSPFNILGALFFTQLNDGDLDDKSFIDLIINRLKLEYSFEPAYSQGIYHVHQKLYEFLISHKAVKQSLNADFNFSYNYLYDVTVKRGTEYNIDVDALFDRVMKLLRLYAKPNCLIFYLSDEDLIQYYSTTEKPDYIKEHSLILSEDLYSDVKEFNPSNVKLLSNYTKIPFNELIETILNLPNYD
jgi:hypothetical protein